MNAVIFDTETSGVEDPINIVEAAWLRLRDVQSLEVVESFESRYNPGKPIELGALATHHIYDEEVADCPLYNEFRFPEDVDYVIGHNIDFDCDAACVPSRVKKICTLAIGRALLPTLDKHTQETFLFFFEREKAREAVRNAHSALADIHNCRIVLWHLLRRSGLNPEGLTWEDVWKFSEECRVPKVMAFGKHKGAPIERVPRSYRRWLLQQPDVDPYLAQALKAAGT